MSIAINLGISEARRLFDQAARFEKLR